MKKILLSFLLLFILNASCSNKKSDTLEKARSLYQQSIQVHDEVMPRMDEIMRLQSDLQSKKELVSASESLEKIEAAISDLEKSHLEMMEWMRSLHPVPKTLSPEDEKRFSSAQTEEYEPENILKYQQKTFDKIIQIKKQTEESINRASELLNSL